MRYRYDQTSSLKLPILELKKFENVFSLEQLQKFSFFIQISRVELMGINATSRRYLTKPI